MPAAISCITLPVDDLERSLAFYRTALGLEPEASDDDEDDTVTFDLDGVHLVLMESGGFEHYTERVGYAVADRGVAECILSWFAESQSELDAVVSRVRGAGAEVVASEEGHYFLDPDGHMWEVGLGED